MPVSLAYLSLTATLASVVASINVIGQTAFSAYFWNQQAQSSLRAASGACRQSAEQFASIVGGAVERLSLNGKARRYAGMSAPDVAHQHVGVISAHGHLSTAVKAEWEEF